MSAADLPYNRSLADLESLLARVERPGDFCTHGALALPMPALEIDGVGTVSFPLPLAQASALIAAAELAPYGRGEETVHDTSVRRVWQIDAARVRLGGKHWAQSLRAVLAEAARGLGCEDASIQAELYKLLVYDPGGFFLPHRDSEKSPGMFGTLLIQLPSPHLGGELRIRHGSREAQIDLSATDPAELGFAAFYADCEHEVRPVAAGHRLCLVFNLLRGTASDPPAAGAPSYDAEVTQAARVIGTAFAAEGAPSKLVWLLEHQYSQAELAFDALKGVDAAVAGVLRRAAEVAACSVHLAVVHIEESGPAEVQYVPSRGRRHHDPWEDGDEIDATGVAYDVIEVADGDRYIDHWVAADGPGCDFGKVPLADGELLPADALDDEPPDEDRLLEATGNEGVSFERAYRRVALVLWPQARQIDVLLQAGVGSALPALELLLAAEGATDAALTMAGRIVAHWSQHRCPRYAVREETPLRVGLLRCLARFGATATGERFMRDVLVADYDGGENSALADAAPGIMSAPAFDAWWGALLDTAFLRQPRALCELLFLLEAANLSETRPDHSLTLRRVASALVDALPGLSARPVSRELVPGLLQDETAADAESCHRLLFALQRLVNEAERGAAVSALIDQPQVFDPGRVLVPALQSLCAVDGRDIASDAPRLRLWRHGCTFLLARSEFPPPAPTDWSQPVVLSCHCADCQALQSFALAAGLREQRFRVRQDRRQHLQAQIAQHGLDMSQVTERTGSPQTLVCRKTRQRYRRLCRQHAEDLAAMRTLRGLAGASLAAECARLDAATSREPQPVEG